MDTSKYRRDLFSAQPFRDLESMRRRFEEEVARPVMRSIWGRMPNEMKEWAPYVDVIELGDNLVIKAEIPGVKEKDIDVAVSEDALIIKGERQSEADIKTGHYHRAEIPDGGFYRSISLPVSVETDKADASYTDGILRITLPIARSSKPKKVTVNIKKA